jgi:hypothetical protein
LLLLRTWGTFPFFRLLQYENEYVRTRLLVSAENSAMTTTTPLC